MDIFIQRLQSQSRPCPSHHETVRRTRKRLRPNFPKNKTISQMLFSLECCANCGAGLSITAPAPIQLWRLHFHVEFCTLGQTASIIELGKVHVVQTRGQGNNKTTSKFSNARLKRVFSWSIYTLVFRRFIDTFPY